MGLGTNSGFNRSAADRWAGSRGIRSTHYDVIVVGATEAGCMAARQAAELGKRVLLTSDNERFFWMSGWGLNQQDVSSAHSSGILSGLARKFFADFARFETPEVAFTRWWRLNGRGRPGWYQRQVAKLLTHPGITLLPDAKIRKVTMDGARIASIRFAVGEAGAETSFTASVWIEGTPCGDVVQRALSTISIGREAAATYGEAHGGALAAVKWDNNLTVDPYVTPGNSGSGLLFGVDGDAADMVGAGDGRVMAFGYRLFLTSVAADKLPFPAPDMGGDYPYDPANYELLGRAFKAASDASSDYYSNASTGLGRILQFYDVAFNGGTAMGPTYLAYADLNSGGAFSTNYPNNAECLEYITASDGDGPDYARRAEIAYKARQHILGLIYWLLHSGDSRIPASIVTALGAYGLSNKELGAYGGVSPQFYEREGARPIGETVLHENHMVLGNGVSTTIAYGFYDVDSHPVRRLVVGGQTYVEGAMLNALGYNYGFPVPMEVLFPKRAQCTNLLCASQPSVSRVMWCSLRVAPSMMMIGQAAGAAASLAIDQGSDVQDVQYTRLRTLMNLNDINDAILLDVSGYFPQGTVTTTGTWSNGMSRFGYIGGYYKTTAGSTGATIRLAPNVWEAGQYEVFLFYSPADTAVSGDQGRATNLAVTVSHADGTATKTVNQQFPGGYGGHWESLGVYQFRQGTPSADYVEINDTGANGRVTVSAIKLVPVVR